MANSIAKTASPIAVGRRDAPVIGWEHAALLRRLVITILILSQTGLAIYAMLGVLPYHGGDLVEVSLLLLFGLLFGWISAGFWVAVYGFVLRRRGGDPQSLARRLAPEALEATPLAATAIVFPIYHEDVSRTFSGLRSTYLDLQRTGELEAFEFFVLSDSRDPDIWLAEQEAWYRLCEELSAHGRIHYRRRVVNLKRKTGNVADFFRRWGRRFRYTVVMDADSLMQGRTLARMVRMMELAPKVGILQTSPAIVNASSTYARIQQFANRVYGPLFTEGLAAMQLGDATFWGHNAIIRTEAFMRHCGLRRLRGWGFLGGEVLSHDFVEAALMRRAGYEVWLEPDLDGSFEESPPTLVDELLRDQRWAKGNLQHLQFIFRPRIRFAQRLAFFNGIMSYLASPLWLAFLVLSTVEVARFTLMPVEYFPEPHLLHPLWPEWRPEWAIMLALGTVVVLFMPKLLALVDVLLDRERRRALGGAGRLGASIFIESLVSMLVAPIKMLAHSQFVTGTLLNVPVHWAGQNRTQEVGWGQALGRHALGSLLGVVWSAYAYWLDPMYFYWSLPVALPLVLAAPVTVVLSRFRPGRVLQEAGLLMSPEEAHRPELLRDMERPAPLPDLATSAFEAAVLDPWRNRLHVRLARQRGDTPARVARRKELLERCLNDGAGALDPRERSWLAQDAAALATLHRDAWRGSGEAWRRALDALCGGS